MAAKAVAAPEVPEREVHAADFFDPATGIADTVQRTLAARKLPLAFLGDRPAGVGDSHMFFKDIDALTAHVEADKAA